MFCSPAQLGGGSAPLAEGLSFCCAYHERGKYERYKKCGWSRLDAGLGQIQSSLSLPVDKDERAEKKRREEGGKARMWEEAVKALEDEERGTGQGTGGGVVEDQLGNIFRAGRVELTGQPVLASEEKEP